MIRTSSWKIFLLGIPAYFIGVNEVQAISQAAPVKKQDDSSRVDDFLKNYPDMVFELVRNSENETSEYDFVVELRGAIKTSTPQQFLRFLEKNSLAKQSYGMPFPSDDLNIKVKLQSPGGNLEAGMALGRLFRHLRYDTEVMKNCSSACSYAFMGGIYRYYPLASEMIIHRFKPLVYTDRDAYMQSTAAELGIYINSMGVSPTFIDRVSRIEAGENLPKVDALALNIANDGKGNSWSRMGIIKNRGALLFGRTDQEGEIAAALICDYRPAAMMIAVDRKLIKGQAKKAALQNAVNIAFGDMASNEYIAGDAKRSKKPLRPVFKFDPRLSEYWKYTSDLRLITFNVEGAMKLKNEPVNNITYDFIKKHSIKPISVNNRGLIDDIVDPESFDTWEFSEKQISNINLSQGLTMALFNKETDTYSVISQLETQFSFGSFLNFWRECDD